MTDSDPLDPFGSTDTEPSQPSLTRRRVLGGLAGVAGTAATGGVLLTRGSQSARASIAVDGLTVPDASFTKEAVTPELSLSVDYSFDVGSGAGVDSVVLTATVGGDAIATETLNTSMTSADTTAELSGPIADSSAWSATDFEPAIGESVDRSLTIGVSIEVRDGTGDVLASDAVETTAAVSVTHPQESKRTASIGATGEVTD